MKAAKINPLVFRTDLCISTLDNVVACISAEVLEEMATLPSSSELQSAAKDGAAGSRMGELVLRAITYGTHTHESLEERNREACRQLVGAWEHCPALEDSLVDSIWLRGCILTSAPAQSDSDQVGGNNPPVEALVSIIKSLMGVPGRTSFYTKLQCNLMPSLIDAVGLSTEQDLLKRLKVHNTQVNYKQQKYNLLQEESEGYSKVLDFLVRGEPNDEEGRRCRLRQIVGTFELDPNRVMDLTIDTLESKLYPDGILLDQFVSKKPEKSPKVQWLLGIMKEFSRDELPSLISFKLSTAGGVQNGLLRTVAFLASEDLLNLHAMIHKYYGMVENEVEEAHKVFWMKEKKRIRSLTMISLSGTKKEDPKLVELTQRLQRMLDSLKQNHLLSIILVLLQWGEWSQLKPLMSSETWRFLCDLFPDEFGHSLCNIAQDKLEPWSKKIVGTPTLAKPWLTNVDAMLNETSAEVATLDHVVELVAEPLLFALTSGCIALHPVLYCQLCRVFRTVLSRQQVESKICDSTYDFFSKFMVPCLSLFPANPALSTELWSVLQQLPYATRYRLYEDWKGSGLERHGMSSSRLSGKPLPVVEREIEAGKAARYALKRLSKDNIRDMSRQLAKVTHSCPLVVFGTILNQIESYDNMVEVMVEAQRYTNPLGLDILGFCILSRLSGTSGGVNRSRLKEDGVNVSQWMQSLEVFAGAFFKRCPFVEFRGILAYLMRRLREGNVMELGILRTLLKVAGGYSFADFSPVASLSAPQLEGRAGSVTLKRETMSFGIAEDINAHAADRIRKVLQTNGFGVSMLILVAQARSRVIFESGKTPRPIKLVGNLYDSSQVVMSILLEFLTSTEDADEDSPKEAGNPIEEYAKELPPLQELYSKFGFDSESAWMLCRPLVRAANNRDGEEISEQLKKFELLQQTFKDMLPNDAWSLLKPELFESFYMNSLYDILCPENVYDTEINRVKREIERLEKGRLGGPSQGLTKQEVAELSRLKKVSETLTSDKKSQIDHVNVTTSSLEEIRSTLFHPNTSSRLAAKAFLTYCAFPRSLQSPDDAMYCAQFAFHLHRLETPNFGTLDYIDELVSVVSGSMFSLTEGEAANLAILLWETWKVVNKWRYQKGLYEDEVGGKPGAVMASANESLKEKEIHEVTHKEFIVLYNAWHASLGAALIGCLQSNEYIHLRSGLSVLTRIVEVFPTRPRLGNQFFKVLEPLQDENSDRPDIRASASAYSTMLSKARDEGKWIEEDAAVAKARADKEKLAAEKRKKKLEKQFQELQRDSEKITEEIGPRERFGRRDGREPAASRAPLSNVSERGRSNHSPVPRENGEVSSRDQRDHQDLRSPNKDSDRRRDRGVGRNDVSSSSSSNRNVERPGSDRNRRDTSERGSRNDDSRDLGSRWVRGEALPPSEQGRSVRSSKRGRGQSPEAITEDRGNAKRARLESEANFDRRVDSRRGSSPPGRARGGAEISRSSRPRRARR